ncbi:MAG TPA: serine hydrolase domain-containing protein [Candidatus Dormibacteraeota bacterium]|nr:serine hydrolase domain-containing protein [Candidatus Dormibacteraeota bacterium]
MLTGTAIDALLEEGAATGAVPGAVVTVVGRDGVIFEGAAGTLSAGGDAPVRLDTMFRIASMTKAMTTACALQLVEQGRLDLDRTVASVVPAFAGVQVLAGFDGDTPVLRAPASEPTVRQLMNHTTGLAYWFINAEMVRYHELTGCPNVFSGLRASVQLPLIADPGTIWHYGVNTDWLGFVIEALSGQTLDAYMAEHIFAPLGMTDATFAPTPEQNARMMAVHARTPDGGVVPIPVDLPPAPEWMAGGHGVACTAGDYGRFVQALLNDGGPILRPESVDLMFTDSLGGIALPDIIRSADPALSNDIPSLPVRQGWGLGLHLFLEDLPGMRSAGSGDWAGIFNSYFWIDRAGGVGTVFLTQVLPFFDVRTVPLALAVEQAVFAELRSPAATV